MSVVGHEGRTYTLGRHLEPTHDPASRAYPAATAPLVTTLHAHVGPILDQGNLGSCFPPGTRVRMADGSERPIEAVQLGEHVVTAEGGTGRVVRTLLRDETGGLARISLWGHAHLRCTREHPILTGRGYVEARDLRIGDVVGLPRYVAERPTERIVPAELTRRYKAGSVVLPEKIDLTPAFGRLFGLWLAEGSADGTKVRWNFGGHEGSTLVPETVRLIEETLGEAAHAAQRPNGTWWVTLYGTPWNELFKALGGTRVETKWMHPLVTSGSPEFLSAMLDGWLAGDGCYRKDGASEGVTVSADLALGMYDIAQALGERPVIDRREATQNSAARMRLPRWTITMAATSSQNYSRQDDVHVWRKVRELTVEPYDGPVYDLTVEGDHSYVAEGIGVHNCTGNACAQALNCDPLLPAGRRLLTEADATAIYSWATHHDPFRGAYPPVDTGSDGLSVAKAARKLGLIGSYRHAFGLQHVLGALVLRPLIIGIPWTEGMFTPDPDGYLHITGAVAGGHELCLRGIDVEARTVRVLNSWSASWGVGGEAVLRWDDLGTLLAQQGDATVLLP